MASPGEGFGIRVASDVAGLSPAMVDYLCRTGVVVPTCRGRGRPRVYSFADLVMLRTVAQLLKGSVAVAKLKSSLRALQRSHPQVRGQASNARFLVTDGSKVYYRSSRDLLEDLTSGQYAFQFVVEMKAIRRHVTERLAAVNTAGE
jgi:DNA-binding transcriptional MerR regulator